MKKTILLISVILFVSCEKESKEVLSDFNLYITTNTKIDSVFISNLSQDREFNMLKYSDTLKVKFNDSINDMYNIWFYSEGKQYSWPNGQIWLNGENVIIKGTFDKGFTIDTVIGSDLYYKGIKFQKKYNAFYKQKASRKKIDSFLLNSTIENIDNPLSLQSADYYMFSNKNDKNKIKKLRDLIKNQSYQLKNHAVLKVHKSIEKLLSISTIDLNKYVFEDLHVKYAKIQLNPNKRYLLDLWFVNCLPCIKDHKKFKQNLELLSKNNIELIGISRDSEQDVWLDFFKKNKYPWKNYRESNYENSLTKDFIIEVFPTYFLIEGDGKIIKTFNAYDDIESYLSN